MKRLAAFLLMALALPAMQDDQQSLGNMAAPIAGAQWVRVGGPGGCAIFDLAVIGTNLFTFNLDCVYISKDKGASWTPVNSGLPEDLWIFSLLVSGTNLFAAGDDGIFLSTDNGSSWNRAGGRAIRLAVLGSNLIASNDEGVFRSADNGVSWSAANKGLPGKPEVRDLAVMGTNIFASVGDREREGEGGIFLSRDNGESWKAVDEVVPERPWIPSRLVVSGANLFAVMGQKIFLSSDNGSSWNAVDPGKQNVSVTNLIGNKETLYVDDIIDRAFMSTDSGKNWEEIGSGLPRTEILCMAVIGLDIFAGTRDLGVLHSSDDGHSWRPVNSGLPEDMTEILSLAAVGRNVFTILDCHVYPPGAVVFRSSDNGKNWTAVGRELAGGAAVNCLIVLGTNLIAGTDEGIFRSTDNGASWSAAISGLPENAAIKFLAASGTKLLAATDQSVFLSMDGGARWTAVRAGWPEDAQILCLAADRSNLYVSIYRPDWVLKDESVRTIRQSTGLGVFILAEDDASWRAINLGLPENPYVGCLVANGRNLLAGLLRPEVYDGEVRLQPPIGLGVYRSLNGGESWTPANSELPANTIVNCLGMYGTSVFAGTEGNGVFISRSNGKSWTALNLGLPPKSRVQRLAASGTDLFVYAYAHSEGEKSTGVWRLPLSALKLKKN